ncbi:MAG: response regulator receiver domain [Acidimicrobiaceae bacterium]|nr:response regulator receiver domain [Acidimicrobiaceae bacterium]
MSAVSDYFRTALLIDDRVAADFRPLERLGDESRADLAEEPTPDLVVPPEEDETPVQPAQLVRAFLTEGVVCSVLEADSGTELEQQVLLGAKIADLLIVDWLIDGDESATIEAIEAVATQFPERLTVIVVFTGAHSLSDVVQRLVDRPEFESAYDYIVRRNNTVVLVFGKPGTQLTDGEDQRQPDSDYRRLPKMIRDDLEMVFKGFMPEFAFSGINALRDSTPRILANFNAELDAGALIHRALLPEPSDAADQFVRLLASDFEQVLHDGCVGDVWNIGESPSAVAHIELTGDLNQMTQRLRSLQIPEDLEEAEREALQAELDRIKQFGDDELVREALTDGLCRFRELGLSESSLKKAIPELTATLTGADASNRNLAVMMDSLGTSEMPPRLELGVVLKREPSGEEDPQPGNETDWHLWLCVQPLCDSVRLEGPRAFPLVPISEETNGLKAMICPPDRDPTCITFVTNLHQLVHVRFAPNGAQAVVAEGDRLDWHFTDVNGTRYRVVTRLRPDLAAHVAHTLSSAATRIGTDQSEWLRLGAR